MSRTLIISAAIRNAIVSSMKAEGKAAEKTDAAIQKAVDAMTVSCNVIKSEFLKGNSKTNEARKEVKELFESLFAGNEAQARCYATSFWIAFEDSVPFQRNLFNQKSKAKAGKKAEDKAQDDSAKGADQNKVTIPKLTQGQLIELVTQECAKSPNFQAKLLKALEEIGAIVSAE